MAVFGLHSERVTCPACDSPNVLVVATCASVASLYCLACEHLFAAAIEPVQQLARPSADPSPVHAANHLRCTSGT